jgi:hypothetical protein
MCHILQSTIHSYRQFDSYEIVGMASVVSICGIRPTSIEGTANAKGYHNDLEE